MFDLFDNLLLHFVCFSIKKILFHIQAADV